MRHLLSINDLDDNDLHYLVERGADYASGRAVLTDPLHGKVVGIYFKKTSTRTRTAFSAGALRLGGQIISYGPDDLQEKTGEAVEDTAAVLAGMLDVLVARTAGSHAEMCALSAQYRMSVVNAMSSDEHPTQALADLATMTRQFGSVDGLRVLYLGEGNNTASALTLALSRFRNTELQLRTPAGYGLDPRFLIQAKENARTTGAIVGERHDMADLPVADVVYTTRWQTTGTNKQDPRWRDYFAPFRVDETVTAINPDAVFMHDLPAHRGEEVVGSVLDGPASIAFTQADNKLHSACAVLEWCAG